MKTSSWLLLAALAIPVGCGDDAEGTDTDDGSSSTTASTDPTSGPTTDPSTTSNTDPTTTDTTTAADSSSGSDTDTDTDTDTDDSSSTGEEAREITLQFAGRINGVDAACDTVFSGLGTESNDAQIRDFRFYVSNIRLVDGDGNEVPLELEQDGMWQFENVALLDFEDATGFCSDTGNADLNSTVVGTVPAGDYDGVLFDVGVPNELNHIDPNTAEPPLNVLSMHWNWLAGRKFVRFDFLVDALPDFGWNTHLGSQGCTNNEDPKLNDPNAPPTQDCTRPQRPAIALDSFDPDTNTIVVDAGTLLADADVSGNIQGAPGCMSFYPADPMMVDLDCAAVFPHYGMDWDTGDCADGCSGQTFVTVE